VTARQAVGRGEGRREGEGEGRGKDQKGVFWRKEKKLLPALFLGSGEAKFLVVTSLISGSRHYQIHGAPVRHSGDR